MPKEIYLGPISVAVPSEVQQTVVVGEGYNALHQAVANGWLSIDEALRQERLIDQTDVPNVEEPLKG